MPTHIGAIIPRAKRNAAGEDISRVVVSLRHRRPESDTSSKAVVLRHGRHGVWGEGQIASFKKLSGQEKLALKAGQSCPLFRVLTVGLLEAPPQPNCAIPPSVLHSDSVSL